MHAKGLALLVGAICIGLSASVQAEVLGRVEAASAGGGMVDRQSFPQLSLLGEWQADATTTACSEPPNVRCDTANASIHAELAPGSLSVTASGKSGGITGTGIKLGSHADAYLQFNVSSTSLWTLLLNDDTTQYGEYQISVIDPQGDVAWWWRKSFPDSAHDQSAALQLGPGTYQLQFDLYAVNLTDTGRDAGGLSLTMTTPVPLPPTVWLFASAVGVLSLASRRATMAMR